MTITVVLSLIGCIAFFLLILGVTVTLPSPRLISFFPEDVQERLRPRVENQPMTFKRFMGWVILFPETEGCKGWKKFGYNRKQQIRQCVAIVVLSLIVAFICTLL